MLHFISKPHHNTLYCGSTAIAVGNTTHYMLLQWLINEVATACSSDYYVLEFVLQ